MKFIVHHRTTRYKGGAGSGFYGHAGRPGQIGGSTAVATQDLPVESANAHGFVTNNYENLKNAHENPQYWILPDGMLLDNVSKRTQQWIDHSVSITYQQDEQWYKESLEELTDQAFTNPLLGYRSMTRDDIKEEMKRNTVEIGLNAGAIRASQYYEKIYVHTNAYNKSTLRRLQRLVDEGKLDLKPGGSILWDTSGFGGDKERFSYEDFMTAKYVLYDEETHKVELKQWEELT